MESRIHQGSLRGRRAVIVARLVRPFISYKEICYGAAIGASVWVLDAVMHANQRGRLNWGEFVREFVAGDSAQFLFRALFVAIAGAFGFSLWRSNRRRRQVDELHAAADLLHRQIAGPLLLIVGYCQMLSLKPGWPVGREAIEIVDAIHSNARKISATLNRLPPPGAPIQGEMFAGPGVAETEVENRNPETYRLAADPPAVPAVKQGYGAFDEPFCHRFGSDLTSPVNPN